VNNDGGTKCRAQVRDSRISENAGKVEQGRPAKRERKRERSEGGKSNLFAPEMQVGLTLRRRIGKLLRRRCRMASIEHGVSRDSSKREDPVLFCGKRLNGGSIQRGILVQKSRDRQSLNN